MKVLNLYCGVGGNRKLWPDSWEVTAVDAFDKVLDVYHDNFPGDVVVEQDCRTYLTNLRKSGELNSFDAVWSSPPCQSHSKMVKATRHNVHPFPDMTLYEEIIFFQHRYKGEWVVENVQPYYSPLIEPSAVVGRHLFWTSGGDLSTVTDVKRPANFINTANLAGMRQLQDWLGIHYQTPIYYDGNHCPCQVLRNAVHPELGKQVAEKVFNV